MNSMTNRSSNHRVGALLPALLSLLLVVCLGAPASAQVGRLEINNLERLAPLAVETVDVTLDGALLKMAARFLNRNKPEEAKIREIVESLQGVYVKSFQFENAGEYTVQDVEAIRMQLNNPGWSKIATVRSRRSGDNVDVHLQIDGGIINGVAVLVADPRRLTVVNVIGPIDPEKISELGLLEGRFGIPRLDLDWATTRRIDRNN